VFAANQLYAIRINDEFSVDVMPSIAGQTWESMQPHIITMAIDDTPVQSLDLPCLLKTKQGLRPKDQMDGAVIAAAIAALNGRT
jgi:hypothetical protein